jgi:hypothetical protein
MMFASMAHDVRDYFTNTALEPFELDDTVVASMRRMALETVVNMHPKLTVKEVLDPAEIQELSTFLVNDLLHVK